MGCRSLTMLKLVAPPVSPWKVAALAWPMTTTASESMVVVPLVEYMATILPFSAYMVIWVPEVSLS